MGYFFGVIIKFNYIKRSFLCILECFLKVKVQNGGYVFGLLKFQIFFGVHDMIPDNIFWMNGRCWTRSYIGRENESTPFLGLTPLPSGLFCMIFVVC